MGKPGLPHSWHRLPGVQAAGDRRGAGRAGPHEGARPEIPRRSHSGAQHRRRRVRKGADARAGAHARGAGSEGARFHVKVGGPVQLSIPTPTLNAKVRGHPFTELPHDLYIPPDALEVFFETFEGPLDLLLYLIRKANIDILDIPMARLTEQYMEYVEVMRTKNLELAAEYLVMAAMLMEIKSRMLLPQPAMPCDEEDDPRAELVRRLPRVEVADLQEA